VVADSFQRLLAGPSTAVGAESPVSHLARLGPIPRLASRDIISMLDAAGLEGRGGGGFPVGRKWRGIADRPPGPAVVVANGAEGEPASAKDRLLTSVRPHLVIDGAVLAADAVGASEIVFYVGSEHIAALAAMRRAIEERQPVVSQLLRLVPAPIGYVSGEATAAVHYINDADARPTSSSPRVAAAGVGRRATLVQNVESLAYAALIARFGEDWYRTAGRHGAQGSALVTVNDRSLGQRVIEIELGTPLGAVVAGMGRRTPISAVMVGGYFGTWARARDVWDLPLEPRAMEAMGLTFGCGMIGLLPTGDCGVAATARIMSFMASASAGQCGPCVHGLAAIESAVGRLAAGRGEARDIGDLQRWTGLVAGRGACRHPDGAAQLMASAMDVFAAEFAWHARAGTCSVAMTGPADAVA
jgi:NADH:ubiquinone oxidoreductase subunit F (NADH-binding)